MSLLQPVTKRRAQFRPLRVTRVERLTDGAVTISFAVPERFADDYAFEPGQHLTLRRLINGEDVRRSYSICLSRNAARERHELRVGSALLPGGKMSTWLNTEVKVGDEIEVMRPMGTFTTAVQPAASRHHVAFAGGSGITPVLSLITTFLEEEPNSRVTLVYGNRRTDTIMFLEELEDLKNAYPERFHLIHVLSREPHEVELFTGRIDADKMEALFATILPIETVDEWYLCGPLGMVTTAQDLLSRKGVGHEHVHHEIFHVDAPAAPLRPAEQVDTAAPPEAVVTVTLDGRTTTVPMPAKAESILSATLRERPDAPYSCTGGVCGTCRATLVTGEVSMDRNYALEPDEIEAGIILACQSHPVTDEVTIDYDA